MRPFQFFLIGFLLLCPDDFDKELSSILTPEQLGQILPPPRP
ncbi:hypothetical protein RISK_003779 [Rhodopirellula islandica]|uniref:Uncharacterized protein n=1 Tax=Rhodopirellula islandica TaxID=595434 RepID=A0A0J1BCB6_RHOIS|nr:hypothetical protein RISK_003779 [Rhodopirellula islandica]